MRILRYLPAALLVVVALHQIVRAHTSPLSAWKGGGFGMFSTLDHPASRELRVVLVSPQGASPAAVPEALRAQELGALALPTEANLRALAAAIAATAPAGTPVTAVRIEYWDRRFDAASTTLGRHLRQEVTVAVGARAR